MTASTTLVWDVWIEESFGRKKKKPKSTTASLISNRCGDKASRIRAFHRFGHRIRASRINRVRASVTINEEPWTNRPVVLQEAKRQKQQLHIHAHSERASEKKDDQYIFRVFWVYWIATWKCRTSLQCAFHALTDSNKDNMLRNTPRDLLLYTTLVIFATLSTFRRCYTYM